MYSDQQGNYFLLFLMLVYDKIKIWVLGTRVWDIWEEYLNLEESRIAVAKQGFI